jgi:hypothetical protein
MAIRPIMMMISSRLRAGAVALPALLALAAFAAAPGRAAAPAPVAGAFALTPTGSGGSIRLHATAGRVLHAAVIVRNLSGHAVTVILQRADIQNNSNGNANYVTAPASGTGLWLRLSAGRLRLLPHASRRVAYTVSIPAGATSGSHYAGIVAINAADLVAPAVRGKSKGGRAFTFYRISRQAVPLTVRLPGPLSRSLSLRSASVIVQPIGAGLVLGLLPGGNELTEGAQVNLRVLRGARTIFTYASTLGQLFPGGTLNFRIPWHATPTPGAYHVIGTIRPTDAATIHINQTVQFTDANATQLKHQAPPAAQPRPNTMPLWVWGALSAAALLLLTLSTAVWKLARQARRPL